MITKNDLEKAREVGGIDKIAYVLNQLVCELLKERDAYRKVAIDK